MSSYSAERLTPSEEGLVVACPNCDKAGGLYRRRAQNTYADDPDTPFYCDKCKTGVEEFVEREPKEKGPQPKFADLSPEDLGL